MNRHYVVHKNVVNRFIIHPNFNPSDEQKYIELIRKIREIESYDSKIIYVSQEEYNILEDAVHETMKGKGHQFYGKEIKVGSYSYITYLWNRLLKKIGLK